MFSVGPGVRKLPSMMMVICVKALIVRASTILLRRSGKP